MIPLSSASSLVAVIFYKRKNFSDLLDQACSTSAEERGVRVGDPVQYTGSCRSGTGPYFIAFISIQPLGRF